VSKRNSLGRVALRSFSSGGLGPLPHDKVVAQMMIAGPMNGEIFLAYIEQCLAPTLQRDDIVMMDSLPAHKVAGIEEAIVAAGATQDYLYLRKLAECNPCQDCSARCARSSAPSNQGNVPTISGMPATVSI
jgi:hypothetical protein